MELKPNELRIGNIVECLLEEGKLNREEHYWHTHIIDAKDIILLSNNNCNDFRSKVLTKEWLLTFGFEQTSLHFFKKNGIIISVEESFYECLIGNVSVKIKYVHQLQNLYFALTGEELKRTYNKQ